MTVIKLDAATLEQLRTATGTVLVRDDSGHVVLGLSVFPLPPEPTEAELDEAERDPVEYSLDEAWDKIRRGEKL